MPAAHCCQQQSYLPSCLAILPPSLPPRLLPVAHHENAANSSYLPSCSPTSFPNPLQVAHGIAADSELVSDLREMFRQLDPTDSGRVKYDTLAQALQVGWGVGGSTPGVLMRG